MDQVVIAGSGVSTGVPVIGHLKTDCACRQAMASQKNNNRRNNVSLLIRRLRPEGSPPVSPLPSEEADSYERKKRNPFPKYNNILIDAGKTFRESYFSVMAPLGVDFLDSVLITHDHADAMAGLDDVRDLQYFTFLGDQGMKCDYYIPTYLSKTTYTQLCSTLGYITKNGIWRGRHDAVLTKEEETKLEADRNQIKRLRATSLEFIELSDLVPEPVQVQGLEGVPFFTFPVFHGGTYRSMGYAFGSGLQFKDSSNQKNSENGEVAAAGTCIVYISDVSAVPEETMKFLQSIVRIDVLFLDLLMGDGESHYSHFVKKQFEDFILELEPIKAYGIGMYCDLEHEETNESLALTLKKHKEEKNPQCKVEVMQCGFDGQSFDVRLS